MKCIIMAGGFAKRLWPITSHRPKPLLPVAGKPIIDYILEKVDEVEEIDKIYVSTNMAFATQFKQWHKSKKDKRLRLVIEETSSEDEKLGTIGALHQLIKKEKITDDCLVLGGDNILTFSLEDFVNAYDGKPLVALYDLDDLEDAKQFGVVEVKDNVVVDFQEKPELPKSTLVSTACYLWSKNTLNLIDEYLKKGNSPDSPGYFLQWLHKKTDVHAFVFQGKWYDVGSRQTYLQANIDYLHGENMLLSDDVNHSRIKNSYVGKNCKIANSVLRNCVIFDDVEIEGCVLKNCVVDSQTRLVNLDLNDSIVGQHTQLEKKKLIKSRRFILPPITGTELL